MVREAARAVCTGSLVTLTMLGCGSGTEQPTSPRACRAGQVTSRPDPPRDVVVAPLGSSPRRTAKGTSAPWLDLRRVSVGIHAGNVCISAEFAAAVPAGRRRAMSLYWTSSPTADATEGVPRIAFQSGPAGVSYGGIETELIDGAKTTGKGSRIAHAIVPLAELPGVSDASNSEVDPRAFRWRFEATNGSRRGPIRVDCLPMRGTLISHPDGELRRAMPDEVSNAAICR